MKKGDDEFIISDYILRPDGYCFFPLFTVDSYKDDIQHIYILLICYIIDFIYRIFCQIWSFIDSLKLPTVEEIGHHEECVRDVAWCNNIGLANKMIASCSDKVCKVWKYENKWSET